MDINDLSAVLEGILFASGGSVSQAKIAEALELPEETVEAALEQLAGKYRFERRGIRIVRLEDAWQMTSSPEFAPEVRRALELRKPPPLSKAAMEVLALIAYYQPVTRAYIEQIRGVDSSSTVGNLSERGLIEDCGYMDVPGRPRLFRTTDAFLRSFGITHLSELPDIGEHEEGMMSGQLKIGESVDGEADESAEPHRDDEQEITEFEDSDGSEDDGDDGLRELAALAKASAAQVSDALIVFDGEQE